MPVPLLQVTPFHFLFFNRIFAMAEAQTQVRDEMVRVILPVPPVEGEEGERGLYRYTSRGIDGLSSDPTSLYTRYSTPLAVPFDGLYVVTELYRQYIFCYLSNQSCLHILYVPLNIVRPSSPLQ